jgi:stress-induced morphogen
MNVDETMSFSSTDSMEGSASDDDDGSLDKRPETNGQQYTGINSNSGRTNAALSPKGPSPSNPDTGNVNESMTRDQLAPKPRSPSKRDSPASNKEAQIVDSLQKLSPMSDSEWRRRRKHRSTPYDDSSSAGNETEEEMRKEKYKNTPYDDSSSADDAEDEKYRRAKHQSLYHDDSTSAGGRTEEEARKQRHMNVPYDDSSTAGEETDEHDRRLKHEHLPYDDSSSAEDENDNGKSDRDGTRGWGDVDQEELIRRKYRQEHQLSSSPRNSPFKNSSPLKVGTSPIKMSNAQVDEDEDYEFASSVVKYWDQLLLGPGTDMDTESENLDTAGMLNTSQSQMKSNSRSHSANEGSPLAKSQSRDVEVTFDKFKQMSDQERHDYLYSTLESATQTAKRLDFIGSDYTETLKDEITDLANLLGLDPNEVLEGRVQEQMGHSPQKVGQSAVGNRQNAYIQKSSIRKKSKRSKRAQRQQLEASRLSLSSPRRPDVPKVMAPVSTLKQSPAVKLGPPKQSVRSSAEFFPASRHSASSGNRAKTRVSSTSSVNRGRKSVPQGSVSYVSVSRSGPRMSGDEVPNYYSDEAVPRDFSPSKQKAHYATRLSQRQSQPRQTMDDTNIVVVNNRPYFPSSTGLQNRQRPSSAPPLRPSMASSFKSPAKAQAQPSPSSSKRPIFKVSAAPRPLSPAAVRPAPPPPTTFVSSVKHAKPKRRVRAVTSSLSAPTMSSLARANDVLTRYLDFMVQSKPSIPWDQYSRKIVKRANT